MIAEPKTPAKEKSQMTNKCLISIALLGCALPAMALEPIEADFQSVHRRYEARLGGVDLDTVQPRPAGNSYQQAHDKGMFVWVGSIPKFYFLRTSPASKAEIFEGISWNPADNQLVFANPVALRAAFASDGITIQQGDCLPEGGGAKWLLNDPSLWSTNGRCSWKCAATTNSVYYQRFARGYVIGPFRQNPKEAQGQLFAIFDDGTFEPYLARTPAAMCADRGW